MSTDGVEEVSPLGLGTRTARGMVYLFAGSSASKLISFGAQIILSYLLSPSDFGVVALAYTITIFIQVIEQAGVGDILVQRRNFRFWAIPGFWLALTLGVLSCLLIIIAAPIASKLYRNEQLFWILLVLAPASVPNALAVVPRAQLSRQLRFGTLAAINLSNLTLRLSLTVLFAWIGFGPFSFVAPLPITNAIIAVFLWWFVRPVWALRLKFRRWRYLIGDSTRVLMAELQRAFLDQSDYILLGLYRAPEIVGIYFFGFSFSIQLLHLFTFNLMNVLFPALTTLNDQPQHQFQSFLKAQRILAMLGISSCLLQAAIAEPVVHLLLDPKWIPSIVVIQILCIGMTTRMIGGSSYALLKSQGRFRTILWNRWGFVVLQVAGLILVLSLGGNLAAVAATVAIVSSLLGPVTFYTAIRPYGAGWSEVGEVLMPPLVCGAASVGLAALAARAAAAAGYGYLPQLIVTVAVAVALNALLARLWMRPVWDDLWLRIRRLIPLRAAV